MRGIRRVAHAHPSSPTCSQLSVEEESQRAESQTSFLAECDLGLGIGDEMGSLDEFQLEYDDFMAGSGVSDDMSGISSPVMSAAPPPQPVPVQHHVRVGVGVILRDNQGRVLVGTRRGSHGAGTLALPGRSVQAGRLPNRIAPL